MPQETASNRHNHIKPIKTDLTDLTDHTDQTDGRNATVSCMVAGESAFGRVYSADQLKIESRSQTVWYQSASAN